MWYIIANPAARGGAMGKAWPEIERVLQALGISYHVSFTERRGHAMRLVEDALLKGGRQILGIGGDGTNHELINGLFNQSVLPPETVDYALLPFGTGNDWARQYQLPHDPHTRLSRLLQPNIVRQDIGLIRYRDGGKDAQRYFVNVAGLAYDGFIVKKMLKHPAQNRLQYLLAVARYLFEYQLSRARITFDGESVEDEFYTVNVGLCRYSGGGMQLVPQAIPNDGLFGLTFARRIAKLEVLLQTPRFYNGTILEHRAITGIQAREIAIQQVGDAPYLLEADGEFLGETPASFTLLDNRLRVVL